MKRKLVKTGSSLAVTLPAEVGVRHFEGGKPSRRFRQMVDELVRERAALYRALAR